MDPSQQQQQRKEKQQDDRQQQHIILFYKYHPLSDDPSVTELYRLALHTLCQSLGLTGRILVGCSSNSEGINGTLAGPRRRVKSFTVALSDLQTQLLGKSDDDGGDAPSATELLDQGGVDDPLDRRAVQEYWTASREFFDRIGAPVLALEPDEFKWSAASRTRSDDDDASSSADLALFPDLNVKLVDELIGSGGAMKGVPIQETSQGYLTPDEWHKAISHLDPKEAVLIDCRNQKEYEIGHFTAAVNPETTVYSQFPKWVEQNQHLMENKTVYMYCTGGIRCEKSAAYVRRVVPSAVSVQHLRGGIHKYLERYGGSTSETETAGGDGGTADTAAPLWRGRNFVFDGRGAATAEETYLGRDGVESVDHLPKSTSASSVAVVGRCVDCDQPYDRFDPHCVCTVCREPTMVCTQCREGLVEYHCRQHRQLRHCYFFDLSRFSVNDLERQIQDLHSVLADIAVGKRFKSKRKTLTKQLAKVQEQVTKMRAQDKVAPTSPTGLPPCRNCGDLECTGRCWGFYGLKRKRILENQSATRHSVLENTAKQARISMPQISDVASSSAQMKKGRNRQDEIDEIMALGLSRPPCMFRDERTGIRVVPPVTRTVHCRAKGKWCGRLAIQVLKEEFVELARPGVLAELLDAGLLRINGTPIDPARASQIRVRMQDTLSRIVHWHEPPVQVPEVISVRKVRLGDAVIQQYGLNAFEAVMYVCDKPASVPVHPAGPYLANSLTMLVEAQEGLPPKSLVPLHRTDRATSGLTLCATTPAVSRIFHKCLSVPGSVHKLYLARVCGRFYSFKDPNNGEASNEAGDEMPALPIGTCRWLHNRALQVDAPVETIDPANGIRAVTAKGKPSTSLFRVVSYDSATDTSLVACVPVTGRNHQLRVHLKLLERPVLGDLQYGGRPWNEASVSDETSMPLLHRSLRHESPPPSRGNSENDCKSSSATCASLPSLADHDVESAQRACRTCRIVERSGSKDGSPTCDDNGGDHRSEVGDDSEAFSKAQLLQGGHAICLHALRYRVVAAAPPGTATTSSDREASTEEKSTVSSQPLWVCDVRVDAPSWAEQPLRDADSDLDALFELSI